MTLSIRDYSHLLNLFVYVAECCPLGAFFHWPHSYGYILRNGAYSINSTSQFPSQGWNILNIRLPLREYAALETKSSWKRYIIVALLLLKVF